MTHVNHHRDHDDTLPGELRGVSDLLDRAGSESRASAPRGLEDRLFAGTRAALAESTGVVARIKPESDSNSGLFAWLNSARFRLAAGVAVAALGVGAAAWLAGRGGVTAGPGATAGNVGGSTASVAALSTQLDADLAAWESEREMYTDAAGDSPLASLHEELSALESGVSGDPWSGLDEANEEPSL